MLYLAKVLNSWNAQTNPRIKSARQQILLAIFFFQQDDDELACQYPFPHYSCAYSTKTTNIMTINTFLFEFSHIISNLYSQVFRGILNRICEMQLWTLKNTWFTTSFFFQQ